MRIFARTILALLGATVLTVAAARGQGQLKPSAPVEHFKFPKFAENGYTQWVLEGARGSYRDENTVRVEEMVLRVYSGDKRMAQELKLESPAATLYLQDNRARSQEAIRIAGANFDIEGVGWRWDGDTKMIEIEKRAKTRFERRLPPALAGARSRQSAGGSGGAGETVVTSRSLKLETTEDRYLFDFKGDVRAESASATVESDRLKAYADAPRGRGEATEAGAAPSRLNAIRELVAEGNVVITRSDRRATADRAVFRPAEQSLELTGLPTVQVRGARISGRRIRAQRGDALIDGGGEAGRAQMILSGTSGLGLREGGAKGSETIILADAIELEASAAANVFSFRGGVEVMAGATRMRSEQLRVKARRSGDAPKAAADGSGGGAAFGDVMEAAAAGSVRIERDGRVATAGRAEFFPADDRVVLTESPRVVTDRAEVAGARMELFPERAEVVAEEGGAPVEVTLPELPNLGYAGSEASGDRGESDRWEAIRSRPTRITSRRATMRESEAGTRFEFRDDVRVNATNMEAKSASMTAVAPPKGASSAAEKGKGVALESILAKGGVSIEQRSRKAQADQAEILPSKGKVVLTGNAEAVDDRGRVTGHRMTLLRDQRRAVVEGGPDGGRAKVTLPELSGENDEDARE